MRLFVALEVPPEVAEGLAAWGAGIAAADPALAPVPVESMHVTLAFLGECTADAVPALSDVVRTAAAPVPALRIEGAVWLAPRRPHVLTAGMADDDGALGALCAALWAGLEPLGFPPEERPFRPHLTVARVRRGQRPRDLSVPVPPGGPFPAAALTLIRSRLGGGAARYEPLERIRLQG